MTNKSKPLSNPSSVRRLLLLPLVLAILLIAADVISQSQLQAWLLSRMEVADGWLLSLFTADIDISSTSQGAIIPEKVIPSGESPVRPVKLHLLAPAEALDETDRPQHFAAASSMSADVGDAPTVGTRQAADELLQQAVERATNHSGTRQICSVVFVGTAATGSRQSEGKWALQQGSLQQNLVIPDSTGALHPSGRLDSNTAPDPSESAQFIGTVHIEPREDVVTLVWSEPWGAAAAQHSLRAQFVTGTLADLQQGLPVELEPDGASASLLQNLLAERLRPLLARRLGGRLEVKDIAAELVTPGSTRIRIEKDKLSWSFRSAATVRLKHVSTSPTL